MRSQDEISQEVDALEALLLKIKPESMFGDDNRGAIRAQIRVLREGMDEDEIHDEWDEDDEHYIFDSAVGAAQWMDGEDYMKPSEDWPTQK